MSFDFLIFDLDGTLIDSHGDIALSVNAVRKEYGFKCLQTSEVRSYLGSGVNALMDKSVPEKEEEAKFHIVERFEFYYKQHLTDTTVMFAGIRGMLEALKNKKKAILSNKLEDFSLEIVKRLGISDYFVKIWGGDTVGVKKPDPKPVLNLIKLTNSDISKTVMIGDSPNDFLAAKAAGIQSIAVVYGYSGIDQIRQCNPDFIVETPEDIVSIVLH
jgi:phosphoglycolate phosphatase